MPWVIAVPSAAAPIDEGAGPTADAAVNRGLAFLARQQAADGSIANAAPSAPPSPSAPPPALAAQTALALTAFLACGHTPGAGKYGLAVQQAVEFLIAQVPEDGYVGGPDKSRMYGQAVVTLAFAQAYGVEVDAGRRERLGAALGRLAGVILKAQDVTKDATQAGGWRYEPKSGDSDLSVTSWCLLALRAAREANVPASHRPPVAPPPAAPPASLAAIDRAIERGLGYVLGCYHAGRRAFSYQPGREPSPAMTAAAALCLSLCADAGPRGDPALRRAREAAKYLAENRVHDATPYPCFAWYVTAHAAMREGGGTWAAVWKATRDGLLPRQQEDGGWPPSRSGEEPGRVYATSMAVLALSTPYRLLPVYER